MGKFFANAVSGRLFSTPFFLCLYFVAAAYVSVFFFVGYPIPEFFPKFLSLVKILLLILSIFGFGKIILNRVLRLYLGTLDELLFAFVLGTSSLMFYIFIVGITGILYHFMVWLYIFCGCLMLVFAYKSVNVNINWLDIPKFKLAHLPLIIPISAAVIAVFITSFTPATAYDSLVYHLSLPKLYLMYHKIYNVSGNLYSGFPQYLEMVFTACLAIGNENVSNLFGFFVFIISFLPVYLIGKTFLDRSGILLSLFLLATMPAIIFLSNIGYVESVVGLFISTALLSFIYWHESGRNVFLLISAVTCGFLFGMKYYTAITIAGINMLIFYSLTKKNNLNLSGFFKNIVVFNFIAFIFALPWLLKNYFFLGNPVFPFLYKILGFKNIGWTSDTAANYFQVMTEYGIKSNFISEFLLLPFTIVTNTIKYGSGADVLGGFGWPLLILTAPIVLFIRKYNERAVILALYALFHIIAWFFTGHVLRFLTVIVPIAVILCASGINWVYQRHNAASKISIILLIVSFSISNIFMLANVYDISEPFNVAIGVSKRSEYLQKKLGDFYGVLKWLNRNLSKREHKVYILGDQRGYYCDIPYIITHILAPEKLVAWANESKSVVDFIQKLRDAGLTHIAINKSELKRLDKSYNILNFSDVGLLVWNEFINTESLRAVLYESDTAALYELL